MHTIHKFILREVDRQRVMMPKDAKILSIQLQHEKLCIWAEVHDELQLEERKFLVFGTGNPLRVGCNDTFLGTVQTRSGAIVWHIYEDES